MSSSSSSSPSDSSSAVATTPSPAALDSHSTWLVLTTSGLTDFAQLRGAFSSKDKAQMFIKRNLIWLYNHERQPFRLVASTYLKATEPNGEFKLVDESITADSLAAELRTVYRHSGIHEQRLPKLLKYAIEEVKVDPAWSTPAYYDLSCESIMW